MKTLLIAIGEINVADIKDKPKDKPKKGVTTVVGTLSPWLQQTYGFKMAKALEYKAAGEALLDKANSEEIKTLSEAHKAAHADDSVEDKGCEAYHANILATLGPLTTALETAKCVAEAASDFFWKAVRLELGLTEVASISLGENWTVLKKEESAEDEPESMDSLLSEMLGGSILLELVGTGGGHGGFPPSRGRRGHPLTDLFRRR